MPNKGIRIILVNWNCKKVILDCLESIRKVGYINSVVVVDNGSKDGSLPYIREKYSHIKIIELTENKGFAEGNNVGIQYALKEGAKYIFILNSDTEITVDSIPNLLKVMEEDKSIGIVGPKILSSDKKIWACGGELEKNRYSGGLIGLGEVDNGQYDKEEEVDFISGTAMFVRHEVFEKCGLLHAPYFIYYEDVELNLKARNAGYKLVFVPTSTIIHHESSSMGKNSSAQEYYMARNHLLLVERNAPMHIKVREFIRLPKTLHEHIQRNEKFACMGIKDYFLRRFGKRDYWS